MEIKNPRVTVVVTTYNRPEMLIEALESISNQTFKDYEIILVDDNSNDTRQLEFLKILGERQSTRIKIIRTDVKEEDRLKTTRYATCINLALKEARGEYITYLCDDDVYKPQRLERMVAFLDANPDKHVCYGSQETIYVNDPSKNSVRVASAVFTNADCCVDHSSVMHRKSCIDVVGGWEDAPEHWGHGDGVFWKKLGDAGFHFHPIAEILDAHVYHDGSWTKKLGEMCE